MTDPAQARLPVNGIAPDALFAEMAAARLMMSIGALASCKAMCMPLATM